MTKQLLAFLLLSLLAIPVTAQRMQTLFDSSWKFFKGDVENGQRQNINDADWRTVELPHDRSIEDLPGQSDSVVGPFTAKSVGSTSTGYVVGGTAWYRKHFRLDDV